MVSTGENITERDSTIAERAVTACMYRLLGSRGLHFLGPHCRTVVLSGENLGIRITDEVTVINPNGNPDSEGGTAYSFTPKGELVAVEAMTPIRVCDATEEAQFLDTLRTVDTVGDLTVELSIPKE